MKLLHIDTSILGGHSVSRQVSAAIVDRLRKEMSGLEVTYRDLSLTPLSDLSAGISPRRKAPVPKRLLCNRTSRPVRQCSMNFLPPTSW
jgi:FMN-dependent NADH-azoreductase